MANITKPVYLDKEAATTKGWSGTGSPEPRVSVVGDKNVQSGDVYYKLPFWTRMGCTPESFKQRTLEDKSNHEKKKGTAILTAWQKHSARWAGLAYWSAAVRPA